MTISTIVTCFNHVKNLVVETELGSADCYIWQECFLLKEIFGKNVDSKKGVQQEPIIDELKTAFNIGYLLLSL